MTRQLGDLFKELMSIAPRSGKHSFIRERADHAYSSIMKLLDVLKESYGASDAADLEKRFLNSVKTRDIKKFHRGVSRIIKEEKERDPG